MTLEEIRNNKELRPYFLDMVSRYIVLKGTTVFAVNKTDMEQIHDNFSNSFRLLSERLSDHVESDRVDYVIQEVGYYYISVVQFGNYQSSN